MKCLYLVPTMLIVYYAQAQDSRPQYIYHTVEWNETVYSIPVHYNITTREFLAANGFTNNVVLQPGQIVAVRPLTPAEVLTTYKSIKKNTDISANEEEAKRAYKKAKAINEAKKLVLVDSIAVDVQAVVAKIEKAKRDFNSAGNKPTAESSMLKEDLGPNGIPYTISTNGYHLVEKKQTLFHIALIYGFTLDELKELNHLPTTDIMIGQMLKVSKEQAYSVK